MNNNILKDFAKYVSSNVLGMLALSCYILADTFFVSKALGTNGLTALNLAIPVYSFIHGTGLMLGIGGATRYSVLKSKKDDNSNGIFVNTVFLAGIFAVLYLFIGIFLSGSLTRVLGADDTVFKMTNTYLKVILLFAPFFIMNNVLICFVRNDGNPKLSMLAMLGGSLSNIVLDYVFMFPFKMGIFGAVFATGLAPIISMIILSSHFIKKQNTFHLVKSKPSLKISGTTMALGFPSLITEVSSGVVIIVFNIIMLRLQGNTGVAAYGIIANLSLVVVAIYTGIAQGMQPLISKAYGRDNIADIKYVVKCALITMLAVSFAVYTVIFLFTGSIAEIFNSDNDALLQAIAVKGLKIYFTAVPFVGFNVIISMLFSSTENAKPASVISLLRGLIVIIPMAFLLSFLFNVTGVWMTFPVTEGIVAMFGLVLFARFNKNIG